MRRLREQQDERNASTCLQSIHRSLAAQLGSWAIPLGQASSYRRKSAQQRRRSASSFAPSSSGAQGATASSSFRTHQQDQAGGRLESRCPFPGGATPSTARTCAPLLDPSESAMWHLKELTGHAALTRSCPCRQCGSECAGHRHLGPTMANFFECTRQPRPQACCLWHPF